MAFLKRVTRQHLHSKIVGAVLGTKQGVKILTWFKKFQIASVGFLPYLLFTSVIIFKIMCSI